MEELIRSRLTLEQTDLNLDGSNHATFLKVFTQVPHILTKLTNLSMDGSSFHPYKITDDMLSPSTFKSLTNLTDLRLSNNNLCKPPIGLFDPLVRNLKRLFLEGNKITSIQSGLLDQLTRLFHLDLSRNNFSHLAAGQFARLTNITFLELSSNHITSIDEGAFEGLINLCCLYLTNNEITTLHPLTFKGLTNLVSVNLAKNKLKSLPPDIFDPTPNLSSVILTDNPDLDRLPFSINRYPLILLQLNGSVASHYKHHSQHYCDTWSSESREILDAEA